MLPVWKSKDPWWILGLTLCLLALSAARPSSPGPALASAVENATQTSSPVSRDEKVNQPAIGESIKMVANQLLQNNKAPPPTTNDGGIVEDVRTPPKMKNQQANKKHPVTKPSPYTAKPQIIENSNAGVAVPILSENEISKNVTESSTSSQGLSTWVMVSGATSDIIKSTTPKIETRPSENKNKPELVTAETKKPQSKPKQKPTTEANRSTSTTTAAPKPIFTRKPVAIVSPNKSNLIASGSAVNENVMNKIKASVLANVQKNKAAALNKTTTAKPQTESSPSSTVSIPTSTARITTKVVTESTKVVTEAPKKTVATTPKMEKVEVSTKKIKVVSKKKQENEVVDNKRKEIEIEVIANPASFESKEAEIELEVSTPAPATTKKPKRKSSNKKKKNKNRRRKPVKSSDEKQEASTSIESKVTPSNSTKAALKNPPKEKPITTQIYNYLSREVMPSVGVGLVSLAGIVGLASYFLYPFSGVVRRAYDTNERKDDIYQQNGDLYTTADGGQTEEEMLGSFFPEVPESNKKINPYVAQTQFNYPQKKAQEQNIRYRNVAYGSEKNSYAPSNRVGQQSVDPVHGSTYSEQIHYDTHSNHYPSYSQMQPVYNPEPQATSDNSYFNPGTQESSDSTYVTDSVHASYMTQDRVAEPTYGQSYSYGQQEFDYNKQMDPNTPVAEALHMGSDDVIEQQRETGYTVAPSDSDDNKHPFVVGNVPKELIQAVTPVTVPEHGPRSLRFRRQASNNDEISNEIEYKNELPGLIHLTEKAGKPAEKNEQTLLKSPIHLSENPPKKDSTTTSTTVKPVIHLSEKTTDMTTKSPVIKLDETTKKTEDNMIIIVAQKAEDPVGTTKKAHTDKIPLPTTTQETKTETTYSPTTNKYDEQTYTEEIYPDTYPPVYYEPKPFSIFGLIRNLVEFKIRLGLSLLQSTSETIARYLRGIEDNVSNAARASANVHHHYHHRE